MDNSDNKGRILIRTNVGELLCGDISINEGSQIKMVSQEIIIDPFTEKIFNDHEDVVMQIWHIEDNIIFATRTQFHKRVISVKKGLFSKFREEINKPGRFGGQLHIYIAEAPYMGMILGGDLKEMNKADYANRLKNIESNILPEIMKMFGGEIIEVKNYVNNY